MRRQHTTKMGKAMRMKFSCIISGCPEGARKWHIQIFALFYIAKILFYPAAVEVPGVRRQRERKITACYLSQRSSDRRGMILDWMQRTCLKRYFAQTLI